jgi:hypothetical protein
MQYHRRSTAAFNLQSKLSVSDGSCERAPPPTVLPLPLPLPLLLLLPAPRRGIPVLPPRATRGVVVLLLPGVPPRGVLRGVCALLPGVDPPRGVPQEEEEEEGVPEYACRSAPPPTRPPINDLPNRCAAGDMDACVGVWCVPQQSEWLGNVSNSLK